MEEAGDRRGGKKPLIFADFRKCYSSVTVCRKLGIDERTKIQNENTARK